MMLQKFPKDILRSVLVFLDDITFINLTSNTSTFFTKYKKIKSLYDPYYATKIQNIDYIISHVSYDPDEWDVKLIPTSCTMLTLNYNIKNINLNDCKHIKELDAGMNFRMIYFIKDLPDHIINQEYLKLNTLSNSIMICKLVYDMTSIKSIEKDYKKSHIPDVRESITSKRKELKDCITEFVKHKDNKLNLQSFITSVALTVNKIVNEKYKYVDDHNKAHVTTLHNLFVITNIYASKNISSTKEIMKLVKQLYLFFEYCSIFIDEVETEFLEKYDNVYSSAEEYNRNIILYS